MNKITIEYETPCKNKIVAMGDMPLGSVGICLDQGYEGTIVRRSVNSTVFLVENLSNVGEDKCWDNRNCIIRVKLLPDAEIKVII